MQSVAVGPRLSFVVVKLAGTVVRRKVILSQHEIGKAGKGEKQRYITEREEKLVEEPAGYMVYFPRGHAIRLKDRKALRKYGLHKAPEVVDLGGLVSANSPFGKFVMSMDEQERKGAHMSMEDKVIRLVEHRAGRNLLTKAEQKHFIDRDDAGEDSPHIREVDADSIATAA